MTQEPIQNIIDNFTTQTPFGARKTAEPDIQFDIDTSFGLTRQRLAWYSNDVLFDSTFFTEGDGDIQIETSATSGDTARIRSAFPGQYIPHTFAEPGIGLEIPEEHIERDDDNLTSLTHGEISAEIVEWNDNSDSGINAHGISFEPDATYAQIRKADENVEFVKQENWNIDPLDGTGPSGNILKPEDGLIYNFPFSWYGHGALFLAIQDARTSQLLPVHRAVIDGETSLAEPNMPVQLTIENKTTADPLGANVGGMQWVSHGSASLKDEERGRTTEETRHTVNTYIDRNVTLSENGVDPFAQPGRPLISIRRDISNLDSRVALPVRITEIFANSAGNLYVFIFDEYDDTNALTGESFTQPRSRNNAEESRVVTDTQATDYTPGTNATLRGMLFVNSDKNQAADITGDSNSRLPIDATAVVTAALPPGDNATDIQPALLSIREGF